MSDTCESTVFPSTKNCQKIIQMDDQYLVQSLRTQLDKEITTQSSDFDYCIDQKSLDELSTSFGEQLIRVCLVFPHSEMVLRGSQGYYLQEAVGKYGFYFLGTDVENIVNRLKEYNYGEEVEIFL